MLPLEYDLLACLVDKSMPVKDGGVVAALSPLEVIQPGQLAVIEGTKGDGYRLTRQAWVSG